MGRPRLYEDRVETGLRLSRQLHARLQKHIGDESQNQLIERLIEDFVTRKEVATTSSPTWDWSTTSDGPRA